MTTKNKIEKQKPNEVRNKSETKSKIKAKTKQNKS